MIAGRVYAKRESITVTGGDWIRSFAVTAAYQPAGERVPSHAQTQVDAAAFDRLRTGSPVMVQYLLSRALRQFPLMPTAHLAGQALFSLPKDYYPAAMRLAFSALGAALLALPWRKANLNLAGWLLIPYAVFCFFYFLMPRAEPAPRAPREAARATVNGVT